jgi:hypothetical protein
MRLIFIFIWLIFCGVTWAPQGKGVFGVCVSFQATGDLCQYIAYVETPRGQTYRRTILVDEFVKYASGYWYSVYNPERRNYFEEQQLACGVIFDSSQWKEFPYCSPMDSLWKLRFRGHPFQMNTDAGWSNNDYRPSSNQEKYLFKEFNIRNIDRDFFVDTNLWKILRGASDPSWISFYKNIP